MSTITIAERVEIVTKMVQTGISKITLLNSSLARTPEIFYREIANQLIVGLMAETYEKLYHTPFGHFKLPCLKEQDPIIMPSMMGINIDPSDANIKAAIHNAIINRDISELEGIAIFEDKHIPPRIVGIIEKYLM